MARRIPARLGIALFALASVGAHAADPEAYTIDPVPDNSALEPHLHLDGSPRGPADYYSPRGLHGAGSEKDLEPALQKLWAKGAAP